MIESCSLSICVFVTSLDGRDWYSDVALIAQSRHHRHLALPFHRSCPPPSCVALKRFQYPSFHVKVCLNIRHRPIDWVDTLSSSRSSIHTAWLVHETAPNSSSTTSAMHLPSSDITPIIAHGLLSVPAALAFFAKSRWPPPGRNRTSQSIDPSLVPGIVRNYAFVLFSIAALCATLSHSLATGPSWPIVEATFAIWRKKLVARIRWSLAIYHVGPIWRAVERILTRRRSSSNVAAIPAGSDLGGPWVHLFTHTAVLASLLWRRRE